MPLADLSFGEVGFFGDFMFPPYQGDGCERWRQWLYAQRIAQVDIRRFASDLVSIRVTLETLQVMFYCERQDKCANQ